MSNQCSNLFEYRSFSLFTPFYTPLKPYPTILRPIFPFHNNLILNSRRSRSRTSYVPCLPLSAQSLSDIVLIATTERQDGSFVFRFGDACEVVEEIESQAETESDVVTILDGDQERQVLVETIERGYGSDGGRLTEVDDGIRNADIDSDVAERDTKVISDLRDYDAELSETLSDISEEEVLSLQSDTQLNNSVEGVESTLDNKTESAAQLDGDKSLNPTISLLDNSLNRDKSVDPEGTVLKDNDDEIEDPLVSVKLESKQVSVMDVKQPYAEDELQKVKRKDTSESDIKDVMPPATMHVSDVELTDAAKDDAEEGLRDMNINEGTLIDEMPASDLGGEPTLDEVSQLQFGHVEVEAIMEVSSTKAMDVEDQAMEDELQQGSTNNRDEIDVAYVMPISHIEEAEPILEEEVSQSQSTPVELKRTMQVSDIEIQDTMNQDDGILQVINETEDPSFYEDVEKGSQDMSTTNEAMLIDWMPQSDPLGDESTLDEVSQLQSAPVKLEATMGVSTTIGIDVKDQAVEDVLREGSTNNNEENDVAYVMPAEPILEEEVCQLQSATVKLEATMEVSATNGMDAEDQAVEDELQQASTSNNDVAYVLPVEPILVEEASQLQSAPVMLEATMEVSTTKGMDVEDQAVEDELQQRRINNNDEDDVAYTMPAKPILEEEVSQLQSAPVKLEAIMEVSTSKGMDVEDQAVEDELQQASTNNNDENDVAYVSQAEPILEEEVTQLQYDPLKLEATMEVSIIKGMDVEDQAVKDELQQGSTNKNVENDVAYVMPAEQILEEKVSQIQSTPFGIKPTTQVSDIEVQDTIGQNLDDGILQVIDEDASESCIKNVEQSSHQVETQPVQEGVKHNMLEQSAETDPLGSSILLKQGTHSSLLEADRIEDKASSSELAEALEDSATVLTTEAKDISREEMYLTGYFLSSGAALLEHPFKVEMMPILWLAANG